jgi:protein-S-isoprenylcysteine O-methyltransferase Ste14
MDEATGHLTAMSDTLLTLIYFAAVIAQIVIRAPYRRAARQNKMRDDRVDVTEKVLLGLLLFGIFLIPLVYALTPWLNFADYDLPDWASVIGIGVMIASLIVFWRSHADLGSNWSASLQIREGHDLVTRGIYKYIRHPMYASEWLWAIAQALLLHNWIAGLATLVLFAPLYFVRVPREEQMMLDTFGAAYHDYARTTGRVFPKLGA